MLAGPRLRSEAQHIDTFISFIQHGASHQRQEGGGGKELLFLAELEQNSRQVWVSPFVLNFACQSTPTGGRDNLK